MPGASGGSSGLPRAQSSNGMKRGACFIRGVVDWFRYDATCVAIACASSRTFIHLEPEWPCLSMDTATHRS